jgi:flavin reductase (DIM6/NTAB) family NADH-FMN oxidoreductase RutF
VHVYAISMMIGITVNAMLAESLGSVSLEPPRVNLITKHVPKLYSATSPNAYSANVRCE